MNENLKDEVSPGVWPDALACWQRLPNKLFFFPLLLAWLALFQFLGNSILGYVHTSSLFGWMYFEYSLPESDDGHGTMIPFIVLGLFWWKRKELLAVPLQTWWPGLLLAALALVMHVAGFLTQQPRLSVLALFTGIFGLMGLAWGRAWLKESFFPFWLFVFCVPLAALATAITFPLRLLVTWLVAAAANLLTIHVVRVGTQLMAPDGSYQYDVVAACSGMRSLVAIFLLATIYGFVMFRPPGKRILFMALALPLSILGNFTRLMCVIFAAELGGQSTGNFVHENWFFSLVPYIPAIAGLLLVGRWLEKRSPPKGQIRN
ncbi:MAG TPA: exosortase/archaeosortase family protein [Verrucomicrobiae bacterium]